MVMAAAAAANTVRDIMDALEQTHQLNGSSLAAEHRTGSTALVKALVKLPLVWSHTKSFALNQKLMQNLRCWYINLKKNPKQYGKNTTDFF